MKPLTYIASASLVAIFALGGCDHNTTRGEYPDRTPETQARADAIRDDAKRQKEEVDREYNEKTNNTTFHSRQIKEKARQDREQVDITRDRTTGPLVAKQNDAKARAKREKEQISADTDLKLKNATPDQAAQIKAEADSKYAEAERKAAADTAAVSGDINAAESKAQKEKADIDAREAKQLSDVDAEQAEAKRKQRQRILEIDSATATQLDKLQKDSANRSEQTRASDAKSADRDREISAKIRDDIANERSGAVRVETTNGVVTLTGTTPTDADRRAIVSKANRVSGVVRVDDRLTIQ